MKKRFIKTPLVGVQVHGAKDVGTRTVNLLMGEHAGEYVRGDIMDANAVIQAFDEIKGSVDTDNDSLEEIVDEIHNLRDATDQNFEAFQEKVEEEIASRTQGDKALDEKINTEKQERVNADTQLRNDLTTEVNRAKASENTLASNIQAEATKRENDDNTIKDNLNAEVTRATAKENEIKAQVDVINGDSTTEGSFRKAIADVIAAAPEDLDTLKEIADKLAGNDDLHTALNQAITEKADASALANEVSRATGVESGLQAAIATKADATALSNYVLTTALNQQVDTLNTALEDKQDAGYYVTYIRDDGKKYTLQKGLELGSGEDTVTINEGGMDIRIFENRIALGTGIIGSNGDDSFSIDCDNIHLHNMGSEITISPIGISSVTDEYTTLFNIGSTAIILGPTNNPNVKISEEGIKFKGKTNSYIPTADGDFIGLSSLASAEDISSLMVGLSKKQNKITVNTVDITDIETDDVTKLRTIVTDLINALSSSGLINTTKGVE